MILRLQPLGWLIIQPVIIKKNSELVGKTEIWRIETKQKLKTSRFPSYILDTLSEL